MGIRMLHRRTSEAAPRAWAHAASGQATPGSSVPALAADASTARIPVDPARTARRAVAGLRRGFAGLTARVGHVPDWRQCADLARGYLALVLALLPRARPRHTLTVFTAPLVEKPDDPGGHRQPQGREDPGQDATP
ncbi:hypothetical protein LK08_26695 [Streptomyces sp. MUSC 125]|uniref:hypothetical protein n=1 Tax=Streptomyces TaxID=1883 RepID=UPI0005748F58|nr:MULTISPECIES: hypothetical protein [Streptomyces]KIE24157.1 hypothetical protein LK08_26695 [Streptomyces sp. MUSC 125]